MRQDDTTTADSPTLTAKTPPNKPPITKQTHYLSQSAGISQPIQEGKFPSRTTSTPSFSTNPTTYALVCCLSRSILSQKGVRETTVQRHAVKCTETSQHITYTTKTSAVSQAVHRRSSKTATYFDSAASRNVTIQKCDQNYGYEGFHHIALVRMQPIAQVRSSGWPVWRHHARWDCVWLSFLSGWRKMKTLQCGWVLKSRVSGAALRSTRRRTKEMLHLQLLATLPSLSICWLQLPYLPGRTSTRNKATFRSFTSVRQSRLKRLHPY